MTPVVMDRGRSVVVPPQFNGNNYAYWKSKMMSFFRKMMRMSGSQLRKGGLNLKLIPLNGLHMR